MEERILGEYTTLETRGEANETVDRQKRYSQIMECLSECGALTAKECAVIMMKKGYIPTSERNFTAPRLTEMSKSGLVEPVGKKVCAYTGKRVAVYGLREVI
ncbi:MAG: DNA gyrase [Clostridia bacterium]|nr:DNA gyrase [Clostridia bacterium]